MAARSPDAGRAAAPDFVVLGLGNPGPRYAETRHNLGFRVVRELALASGAEFVRGPGPSRICPFTEGPVSGILAEPTTYMNRSGIAARALVDWWTVPLSGLLVVADDLDLPLGRIRFRRGGGNGGHNGLRSLIEELGSPDFPRLRLGIGRPSGDGREDIVDFVLREFDPGERESVEDVVERAAAGVRLFIAEGIEAAMNRYNAG